MSQNKDYRNAIAHLEAVKNGYRRPLERANKILDRRLRKICSDSELPYQDSNIGEIKIRLGRDIFPSLEDVERALRTQNPISSPKQKAEFLLDSALVTLYDLPNESQMANDSLKKHLAFTLINRTSYLRPSSLSVIHMTPFYSPTMVLHTLLGGLNIKVERVEKKTPERLVKEGFHRNYVRNLELLRILTQVASKFHLIINSSRFIELEEMVNKSLVQTSQSLLEGNPIRRILKGKKYERE